jgi:plasmid maintenance system antidote protein VapI
MGTVLFYTESVFIQEINRTVPILFEIWLNLQVDYDMRVARRTIWPNIEPRIRVRAA